MKKQNTIHPNHPPKARNFAVSLLLVALAALPPAHAASLTWDSNGPTAPPMLNGSGTWNTSTANWWNGAANVTWNNATPDSAAFGSGTNTSAWVTANVVTLGTGITVGNLLFTNWNSGSSGTTNMQYQITGNTLTLAGTPTITTRSDGLITSTLVGTGFTKDGAGILRVDGTSTAYTGAATISAGTLQIGNNGGGGQLGTGNIINNSSFVLRRAAAFTLVNNVSGTGSVSFQLNSSSAVTLNAPNTWTYSGTTTLSPTASGIYGGRVILAASDRLPTNTLLNLTASGASLVKFDLAGFNQTIGGLSSAGSVSTVEITSSASLSTLTVAGTNVTTYAGLLSGNLALTRAGTGTLTLSGANTHTGGTIVNSGTLKLGDPVALAGPAGFLAVNGGTVDLNAFSAFVGGIGGTGGVITNASGVPVTLTVDTANTMNYAGGIQDNGTASISLSKSGTGVQKLTGFNNYSGSTAITAGTLALGTVGAATNSIITVDDGATLGVVVTTAGTTLTPSSLTVGSFGAGAAINCFLGSLGNPTAPVLAPGALTVNGTITFNVNFDSTGLTVGRFALLKHASVTSLTTALGMLPPRVTAHLALNVPNSSIDLVVDSVSPTDTKWRGHNGPDWDINTTVNWTNSGSGLTTYQEPYVPGEPVKFDDSAVTSLVNLTTTLSPASVTVTNSVRDYTFSGPGAIAGTTALTKSGSATLTIANDNTYAGGTIISAGTLRVGSGGTAGSLGTGSIVNNGTLVVNRSDTPILSQLISGTGGLVQGGAGNTTITLANTYTGPTFITNGVLSISQLANGGMASQLGKSGNDATNLVIDGGTLYVANTVSGNPTYNRGLTIGARGATIECASGLGFSFVGSPFALTGTGPRTLTLLNSGVNSGCDLDTTTPITDAPGGATRLVKDGPSDVRIRGNNTFSGGVQINNGLFGIGRNGTGPNTAGTGPITLATGTRLQLRYQTLNIHPNNIVGEGSVLGNNSAATAIMVLIGTNTYTGSTTVSGVGTLLMSTASRTPGGVSVAAGCAFGVYSQTPGTTLCLSQLDLNGTVSQINTLDFSNLKAMTTTAPLTVTNFNPNAGTNFVRLPAYALATGQYPLVKYDALGGGGFATLQLAPLPRGIAATLVDNIANSSVDVNVTSGTAAPVTWTGATNGTWDINTTANWQTNGTSTTYLQPANVGDSVIFNDTATGTRTVNLAAVANPLAVAVNNSSSNYTFTGNKISGTTGLTKSGSGTLTFANANDFMGPVVVSGGTLMVNGAIAASGAYDMGAVTIQTNTALGGSGLLGGPTSLDAGALLAPGATIGTLSFSNNLTLNVGAKAIFELNKTNGTVTNDFVMVGGVLSVTGSTLTVTNVGPSLVAGDKFTLLSQPTIGFTIVNLPTGYTWTNNLAVDGSITVLAVTPSTPPNFLPGGFILLPNGNVSLTATGAVGATYKIWATADITATPITNTWTLLTNGTVTTTPFTITDTTATNYPQRFYLFSAP
jgi:autotransporter-associated beta strand protein